MRRSGGGFNVPGGTRGVAGGGMGLLFLCAMIVYFLFFNGGGNTPTTDQQSGGFSQNPQPTESAGGLLGQLAGTEGPLPTLAPLATARATARPGPRPSRRASRQPARADRQPHPEQSRARRGR